VGGTTAYGTSTFTADSGGQIKASASTRAAIFNRHDSDGDIVEFRKADSTVGSIGNVGNNIYYSGGSPLNYSTGLLMKGASASNSRIIVPSDDTGAELDAKVSLGRDVSRFKDLYLSGGVLNGSTTSQLYLQGGSTTSNGAGILLNGGSHPFTPNTTIFRNGNSETMRIDASGNLLVGKTSDTYSVAGASIRANPSGVLSGATVTRNGANVVSLNRLTSDGDILTFSKNTTTVGSIGNAGSNVYFAQASKGVGVSSGRIYPITSSGAVADNSMDLGNSDARWLDLYLSGGVFLGGTGSSNKLDDYEEGTWTPTFTGSTGSNFTYGNRGGSYTKIGRQVTLNGNLSISSKGTSSGSVAIKGFPFTVADTVNNTALEASGIFGYWANSNGTIYQITLLPQTSEATGGECYMVDGSFEPLRLDVTNMDNTFQCRFSVTYFTNS
jgi:hypothetical protein